MTEPSSELDAAQAAARAAYQHMRDTVPQLAQPLRERAPLTDRQRRAIRAHERAEMLVRCARLEADQN